jgi:hypothetical protein
VKDLQDALAKRYPDSVSALIHAAKVSDLQQEKQVRVLEQQVQYLQSELASAQEQYEHKLRGLRQEYDRMKIHFEQSGPSHDTGVIPSLKKTEPVKSDANDQSAAAQRIR